LQASSIYLIKTGRSSLSQMGEHRALPGHRSRWHFGNGGADRDL